MSEVTQDREAAPMHDNEGRDDGLATDEQLVRLHREIARLGVLRRQEHVSRVRRRRVSRARGVLLGS